MSQQTPGPPAWVSKRDGRLEPFDADKVSRALFAASETLGQPDAFLARELTDAVLHFLAAESAGNTVPSGQIADLIIKVVRELGQPALSRAFADQLEKRPAAPSSPVIGLPPGWDQADLPPTALAWETTRTLLRTYALGTVFSRDLVAAHESGLLTLGNLETPRELAGLVLTVPPGGHGLVEAIERARKMAGGWLAVDGVETALADAGPAAAAAFARELGIGLRLAGLRAVVNLNTLESATPSPLFGEPPARPAPPTDLLTALVEELLAIEGVRIDWHIGDVDWQRQPDGLLVRLARRAAEGRGVAFAFDRPRQPLPLAEGLDRRHSAVLLTVAVNLGVLSQQTGPGDPKRFLARLGSLARLVLSAAARKRDYLRRHGRPDLGHGFLLERARLLVTPTGLPAAIRLLGGTELTDRAGLDLAVQWLQRLREELDRDGRARVLETVLELEPTDLVGGIGSMSLRQQVRTVASLGAAVGADAVFAFLPPGSAPGSEEIMDLVRHVDQQTGARRLGLLRADAPTGPRQVLWDTGATA